MEFVRAGAGLPSVWDGLRNQIFLGSETFVAELQTGISSVQLLDEIPLLGMALAYLSGDYSMKAIADEFGMRYMTVSRAVKAHGSNKSH